MRIPVPQRFSPRALALFAAVIFAGEQMQGTDFLFSVGVAAYILIWGAAFNAAGGVEYASGAFIFFNGLFTVIVGMVTKVLLWQAGNGNLRNPRSTILCYCLGMAAMWVAAVFTSAMRRNPPLLKDFASLEAMKQASVVSFVLMILFFLMSRGSVGEGILGTIGLLNQFHFLAVILAVTYEVRRSNGRRSINWVGGWSLAFMTVVGTISFSKEGMLIGLTAWFLAAWFNGYNFTRAQIVGSALGSFFLVYYLVPYSQYVRNFHAPTFAENAAVSLKYLSNLNETRRLYEETLDTYDLNEQQHLFDQRVAFLDRLIMFAPDDALITFTNKGNVFGLEPSLDYNLNIIPHFLWKDKPVWNFGNLYAHDLGMVSYEDFTTGISFSPAAEFYHEAKWLGLLLVMPLEMFLAFVVADSMAGNTRQAPWVIVWILGIAHGAAEAGAAGPVGMYTLAPEILLFCYWMLTRVAPFFLRVVWRNGVTTASPMAIAEST
jgi:hypothetical protein